MGKCTCRIDEKGIALITLSNPPMNAFDEEMLVNLEDTIRKINTDTSVKVVVITGDGAVFIVGADVNGVREVKTYEDGVAVTSRAQGIMNRIENSRKPYIAAINGLALGGGTELALACHMRVAGDQAQMGLPEIMLGIIPAFGGTQRMVRLLGAARALEYMLTGRFVDMKEAERVGLVNRVVPHADTLAEALKLARSIVSKGQLAVRSIVEAVVEGGRLPIRDGLALESALFGKLAASEDKVIDEHVAERNSHLAKYETIKKYRIIRQDFSKETGELTATLKVKRKVVQDKYGSVIESMYVEDAARAG